MVAADAYAACLRLAKQHDENFPVASWLLPPASRPHIAAIYAFARMADDFADEGTRSPGERLALLDDWQARLDAAASGRPAVDDTDASRVFVALAETMRVCRLDVTLFQDLLSAFRQDVTTTRYATWADLLDYCRRSANPVGRLVLRVSGCRGADLDELSDAVCTALQLTNFWQDLGRDWSKGRLYVPLECLAAAGAAPDDIAVVPATPAWRFALREATGHTRRLFDQGRPIARAIGGRLGWELRATWLGGVRILDRIQAAGFDVFEHRPALGWTDAARIGWRMLRWR